MNSVLARMGERLAGAAIGAAERGVSDAVVRAGMRAAIGHRLASERSRSDAERDAWLDDWANGAIALVPDEANRQHYEVPPGFFELILGSRLKYSSCLWELGDPTDSLDAAELRMLDLTIDGVGVSQPAGPASGMRVLDLGCGWGSLSLRLAERLPTVSVLAVSNSAPQGDFIRARAEAAGLDNVEHRVVDVNDVGAALAGQRFDRVVSVEMLEHVRNHRRLFSEVAELLVPGGALYLHVFAHRDLFWPFDDDGQANWMARHFFSGGVMPSRRLFAQVLGDDGPLRVERDRWFNGEHYALTLDAWLDRLDTERDAVAAVLTPVYGADTERWIQRWRMFLMACSELFGYADGTEWGVSHQLLRRG